MHLACLGVVKKLIGLWFHKGPLNVCLPSHDVHKLTEALLAVKCYIPSDFVRKTREIEEVSRWKATELKLFLLYIGLIVLKNIIASNNCYNHFMSLNISMVILLSLNLQHYSPYAEELLEYFIKTFEILYGREHNYHNIHGLSHLCDDFKYYDPFDNCRAFPFDNYIKKLKSKIRKHEKPLEQVIIRYSEIYSHNSLSFPKNPTNNPILLLPHNNGSLINNLNGCQYKKLIWKNIQINTRFYKDSCVLTTDRDVFKCLNIVKQKTDIVLNGKHFKTKTLFHDPTDSTEFDIYIVKDLAQSLYN